MTAITDLTVINPATDATITTLAADTPASVSEVCEAAAAASAAWGQETAFARAAMLQAAAARIRADVDQIAGVITTESGKPILEAQFEVQWAADVFDFYAGIARSRGGRVAPAASPTTTNLVLRTPLGVVGAIVPWNYPVLLWAWKAAPALAAGNCVIAKPSPETPLSLPAVVAHLDLPKFVHNIVQGGSEVGDALVGDARIDKVAFTGSAAVGKQVLVRCAEQAKRSTVEMSGHDAMIVWDDCDIDLAVQATLFATFTNGGQVCTAAERIYVRDTIYDSFVARFTQAAQKLSVGDPFDPHNDVGPLVSRAHRDRIARYIADAAAHGARIETGGSAINGPGAYFSPTVLTGLSHEAMNGLGEIFGPVAPIVPIASFEEGIAKANDNRFGLSAHVVVRDLGLAMRAARDLRAGTVWINNPLMDNLAAPFGGFREAGIGRELGEEGFDAYTESKHVWIEHELAEQYWWFEGRKAMVAALAG